MSDRYNSPFGFKLGSDISLLARNRDELAGMAAISIPLLRERRVEGEIEWQTDLTDYLVLENVHVTAIDKLIDFVPFILNTEFIRGIFVSSGIPGYWNLFGFHDKTFLEGMIRVCHTFDVFDVWCYSPPFNADGESEFTEYFLNPSIYYINSGYNPHETDIEEAGDENVQDPYGGRDADWENDVIKV